MSKRPEIDWQACEEEYRAGTLSIRALATKFGCTDTAIRLRAKQHGWSRDLTDAVRKETNARLLRAEVRTSHTREDSQIIGDAADLRVSVVTSHRKTVARLTELATVIADRLAEHLSGKAPDGPFMGDKESPGDLVEKLSRVTSRLIPLERQAHNLDDDSGKVSGKIEVSADDAFSALVSALDLSAKNK